MSLLLRDQVRIVLCPDRLAAVRMRRGLRARIVAKQEFPISCDSADWKPALLMLAELLKQDAWQKADAVVVLSSRFAHYQLLPWSDTVLNAEEQQALAQHVYAQTYGESAARLELRISEGGLGGASVVAGVERELVAGVREVFKSSSLRLISVQPYLMSAFNGWRRQLGPDAQWFVSVEPGVMCAALFSQGKWQSLRVKQAHEKWFDELHLTLHRERITNGLAEHTRKVSVCMSDGQELEFPPSADWSFKCLRLPPAPGFSPLTDGRYGMALAGVL